MNLRFSPHAKKRYGNRDIERRRRNSLRDTCDFEQHTPDPGANIAIIAAVCCAIRDPYSVIVNTIDSGRMKECKMAENDFTVHA